MIDGVVISPLKQFLDARGKVMHMLRSNDAHFKGFGEIYFSIIYPQAVKAWHLHKEKTCNFAVLMGVVKLVLFDQRPQSPTFEQVQELFLGPDNYQLVTAPPRIWYGFQGVSLGEGIIANCATHPHDPEESERMDPFSEGIPYKW